MVGAQPTPSPRLSEFQPVVIPPKRLAYVPHMSPTVSRGTSITVIREGFGIAPYSKAVRSRHQTHARARWIPKTNLSPINESKGSSSKFLARSIRGVASWYCKAGVSVCHYQYPPGSMVAAACGRLRAAMGSSWRGKTVKVTHGSRSVNVTLVDWCGHETRAIDLYYEPMRRLGGSGLLNVTVSW